MDKALELPRVYPTTDTLLLEKHQGLEWPTGTEISLKSQGQPFRYIEEEARFGRVHAIVLDTINHRWMGAADPDWEGTASH